MVLKVRDIEDIHFRVLRLLEANPAMQQRELAEELGVSLGKTNYCLKALLDKGMLKMHNFHSSKRKLAYAYLLTPKGISEKASLTGRFLQRKMDEYAVLTAEIESLMRDQLNQIKGSSLVADGLTAADDAVAAEVVASAEAAVAPNAVIAPQAVIAPKVVIAPKAVIAGSDPQSMPPGLQPT